MENMTQEQMVAMIARLTAEKEALTLQVKKQPAAIKVSDKGAVSVYGLGRFPVTLYSSQWQALALRLPEIEAFIVANVALLSEKAKK